jgi:hypothetical protein
LFEELTRGGGSSVSRPLRNGRKINVAALRRRRCRWELRKLAAPKLPSAWLAGLASSRLEDRGAALRFRAP